MKHKITKKKKRIPAEIEKETKEPGGESRKIVTLVLVEETKSQKIGTWNPIARGSI